MCSFGLLFRYSIPATPGSNLSCTGLNTVGNVRLISATHFPLRRFLDSDQFRKDLFYRINGLTLTIAPLRHRPNDLRSLIASKITTAATRQEKPITGLSTAAAEALFNHDWPGNLRELRNAIERAVILAKGDKVSAADLPAELEGETSPQPQGGGPVARVGGSISIEKLEEAHVRRILC